ESSIGVTNRARPSDPFGPFDLASVEIGADKRLSSTAVKIIAHQHCASDCSRQLHIKIDLLDFNRSLFGAELDCPTADPARAAVDQPVACYRGQNAHPHRPLRLAITPKELAGLGVQTNQAISCVSDIFLLPANLSDDDR